jgi:hypothetical protein
VSVYGGLKIRDANKFYKLKKSIDDELSVARNVQLFYLGRIEGRSLVDPQDLLSISKQYVKMRDISNKKLAYEKDPLFIATIKEDMFRYEVLAEHYIARLKKLTDQYNVESETDQTDRG